MIHGSWGQTSDIIQAVSIRKKQFAAVLTQRIHPGLLQNLGEIPGDARMILAIISQSWFNQVMRVNFGGLIIGDFPVIVPTPS